LFLNSQDIFSVRTQFSSLLIRFDVILDYINDFFELERIFLIAIKEVDHDDDGQNELQQLSAERKKLFLLSRARPRTKMSENVSTVALGGGSPRRGSPA
jgi:hypothetical protein